MHSSPVALSIDLFDYDLPASLIAQTPAARRDQSRLLVVDRQTRALCHHVFADLPHFLRPGDQLFRNNAAVLPARLLAHRPTGGAVECFLLRPSPEHGDNVWWCLVRPGKKLPVGATFAKPGHFQATVEAKDAEGGARVRFVCEQGRTLTDVANAVGEIPLPPYIVREDPTAERPRDLERYQTVYARPEKQVAVAAPTAGLHFTPELLATLAAQGVTAQDLTLHVGLGTFRPIATATIEEHTIHREIYEVPAGSQQALLSPTGRRIAVGTTSLRSIEDYTARNGSPLSHPWLAEASLFVYPPRHFNAVDGLITNFHQPRSTLLCLVAAFLTPGSLDGVNWWREIYREAIAREYRFFSYGDAMLIL